MLLVPISVCLIQAFVAKKQLTKIIRGTASNTVFITIEQPKLIRNIRV